VLYSLRHMFLTRLGESGCDAWTLVRIAGYGSIALSTRQVYPSEDAVLNAMSRLGRHILGTAGVHPRVLRPILRPSFPPQLEIKRPDES
jgi:hypothetical protein